MSFVRSIEWDGWLLTGLAFGFAIVAAVGVCLDRADVRRQARRADS